MKVMVTILKVNKARAKRGFSLEKVMAKLSKTSTTAIKLGSAARSQLLDFEAFF